MSESDKERPEGRKTKGLVVAGVHSGAGKTSVSLALMAALKRRGLTVQAFKVGPDFIDPGHHGAVTGRASHNLDGWMLDREENLRIFDRYAPAADVVVVEGVMGLYDGFDGKTEAGSTAQMAKWLGLPVLLCVDARSMARSFAALALGFTRFDPDLAWVGLLANRIGSPRHLGYLREALESVPGARLVGGLARESGITIPERHLGLLTAEESVWDAEATRRLADWFEAGVDLEALLADLPEIRTQEVGPAPVSPEKPVRLGVARDAAFCFYYEENFRRLEEAGAELVFFSPLKENRLPENLAGLYFGGGYPEVFARELSENRGLLAAVREFGESGRPVYAECGGLMFLSRGITTLEGVFRPMAGLLPLEVRMVPWLRSLGYRRVEFTGNNPLGPAGLVCRGHEFHYSEIVRSDLRRSVYRVATRPGADENTMGYLKKNVLAGYVHLHFGSRPELAQNFVRSCREVEVRS